MAFANPDRDEQVTERRVGLTADLPEEWIEAVRQAKVPEEFAHLDAELK